MRIILSSLLILILLSNCSPASRFGAGVDITFDPRTIGMQIDDTIMQKNLSARLALKDKKYFLSIQSEVLDGRIFLSGKVDVKNHLVQRAIAATNYMGGKPKLTIGSTDSNVPIALGLPAITIGRGGDGGKNHSLDEWWLNKDGYKAIHLALLVLLAETGYK